MRYLRELEKTQIAILVTFLITAMNTIILLFLMGCSDTTIRVDCENGGNCVIDSNSSSNPEVDPKVSVPFRLPP